MKIIARDQWIHIPVEVATCPGCGAELAAMVSEWEDSEDGVYRATDLDVECVNEPDIVLEEAAWDKWFESHDYQMPYVDLLPVVEKVKSWVDQNYRFGDSKEDSIRKLERWNRSVKG